MNNFINIGDVNKQDLRKIIDHALLQKKKKFNISKKEKKQKDLILVNQQQIQKNL